MASRAVPFTLLVAAIGCEPDWGASGGHSVAPDRKLSRAEEIGWNECNNPNSTMRAATWAGPTSDAAAIAAVAEIMRASSMVLVCNCSP
jgi:hypothetical protein